MEEPAGPKTFPGWGSLVAYHIKQFQPAGDKSDCDPNGMTEFSFDIFVGWVSASDSLICPSLKEKNASERARRGWGVGGGCLPPNCYEFPAQYSITPLSQLCQQRTCLACLAHVLAFQKALAFLRFLCVFSTVSELFGVGGRGLEFLGNSSLNNSLHFQSRNLAH